MTLKAIETWRRFVETHDPAVLKSALHPDAVFESPVVHTPQKGAAVTALYLMGAEQVLGGPTFRYTREWSSDTGVVLEFETTLEDIVINGVDMIETTPDGEQIIGFKVMIRPLKAINLVHRLMGEKLQALAGGKTAP